MIKVLKYTFSVSLFGSQLFVIPYIIMNPEDLFKDAEYQDSCFRQNYKGDNKLVITRLVILYYTTE